MIKSSLIAKLKTDGWKEQFIASGKRLQETVENYRKLGYEVKIIPVKELDCDGCTICFEDDNDESVMILTRTTNKSSEYGLLYDDYE